MRDSLILLVVALVVAGAYGYHNNPKGCRQLGVDIVNDTKAIFVTSDSSKGTGDEPPVAGTTPSVPVVSPSPAAAVPVVSPGAASAIPVVSPGSAAAVPPVVTHPTPVAPPPHYSVGFVAQDDTPAAPAASTATALPSTVAPARGASATVAPASGLSANSSGFSDYDEALAAARSHHTPLLILFTGSDWCPYCQKLNQEVLSDSGFQSYVGSHYVFVTIDDLRNTPVSDADKQRIQGLEQKFHVAGFPSLIVVDENEHEKGRIEGYDPGSGPTAVTKRLDQIAQQPDHT